MNSEWTLETGTADYISINGVWRATYIRTDRGFAVYAVHPIAATKGKRTSRAAVSLGGLPKLSRIDRRLR